MRKALWVALFAGIAGMIAMAVGALVSISAVTGVEGQLRLKEAIEERYGPDRAVVAVDRSGEVERGLVVRLYYAEPIWDGPADRERLLEEVGGMIWRETEEGVAGPDRVIVEIHREGFGGCSGPVELDRVEVAPPAERSRGVPQDPDFG